MKKVFFLLFVLITATSLRAQNTTSLPGSFLLNGSFFQSKSTDDMTTLNTSVNTGTGQVIQFTSNNVSTRKETTLSINFGILLHPRIAVGFGGSTSKFDLKTVSTTSSSGQTSSNQKESTDKSSVIGKKKGISVLCTHLYTV